MMAEPGPVISNSQAKVDREDVRIMIDTVARSPCIFSDLVAKLSLRPTRKETKCIKQMYGTVTNCVEIYNINLTLNAADGSSLNIGCITDLKEKFKRLKRIQLGDV